LDLNDFNETVGSLAGSGFVTLGSVTGGTLTVGGNNTSTVFSGIISELGAVTKAGTGTFTLTGSNSYTGVTTVTSGTLQIGNGGTTGSLGSGGVTDNSSLVFNRSDSLSVNNVIGGSGVLVQAG